MCQRCMFAGEMNAAFGLDDVVVNQCLLSRIEQRKRAACKFVVVPHPRCAHFELFDDLRMNLRQIFQRLLNAIPRRKRSLAFGIIRPGVTCEQNSAPSFAAVIGIVQHTNGQVRDGAATVDAFVFFPESPTH